MTKKPIRTIAVTSGKGGVGKTNVSVNLALALALKNRKVCLFDADLGLANVDVLLGLAPRYRLSEALAGERTLDELLTVGPGGIRIISGGSGIQELVLLSDMAYSGVIRAFSSLEFQPDFLIVDTAAGISRDVSHFCKASQSVLVVVCDEPTSIMDAYALIKVLSQDHGIQHFKILANMVNGGSNAINLFEKLSRIAQRFLDIRLEYAGFIPFDHKLKQSVQKRKAVVESFPRSSAALAFKALASRADNWPLPSAAMGHIEFFFERLIEVSRINAEVST